MPEIQPSQVQPVKLWCRFETAADAGNDTLFRVVVLVLGTISVALFVAAVLISPAVEAIAI
jgi:hypothetical protein